MSTRARDTANSAVALVGLIHDAAIEQELELANSIGRLRNLVARMAGCIDAMEEEWWHRRRLDPFPGRTEEDAGPTVDLEVIPEPPDDAEGVVSRHPLHEA